LFHGLPAERLTPRNHFFEFFHKRELMKFAKHWMGLSALALAAAAHADPLPFAEGFDSLAAWTLINNSPSPSQNWFQGNAGIFTSQAGADDSYAAASFGSSTTGAIDNWLISPELTLASAAQLSFYTRAAIEAGFHDSMEVLFSAGSGTSTAGFTSLLIIGGDPSVDYPSLWTAFSLTLPEANTGRIAFRYFGDADMSNYIGVDSVNVTAGIPEPSTYALMVLGLAGLALVRRSRSAPR
jgi:Cleaved Adhesin Domain/PEP-CTERM motif